MNLQILSSISVILLCIVLISTLITIIVAIYRMKKWVTNEITEIVKSIMPKNNKKTNWLPCSLSVLHTIEHEIVVAADGTKISFAMWKNGTWIECYTNNDSMNFFVISQVKLAFRPTEIMRLTPNPTTL